ncbi:PREDICTED: G-protein coupled receptor Mth2-like isoform X1 [Nicrophorus vespilloides]|uniref:G-protein coupled receptor Mth2-like isoform X1 n=1 Tax=Nicrophorus vespilloides TaxID=110193 RepID=A0ABM1M7Y2_NICVS|nr:PREDICTED: G-protein coupled receptor Mth2-like isoform X1 [Nicrophorus vespilloides]
MLQLLLVLLLPVAILSESTQCLNNVTIPLTTKDFNSTTKVFRKNNLTFRQTETITQNGNILGCVCDVKQCIKKCCPLGQSKINDTCQVDGNFHTISVYDYMEHLHNTTDFHVVVKDTNCDGYHLEEDEIFYIQKHGGLVISSDIEYNHSFHDYCIDYFSSGKINAYLCVRDDEVPEKSPLVNTIGMIISMPFLILTFIVYLLLPERNLHAKCLMCYVLSLALAYFFLVFIQFNNSLSPATCAAFAAFCHYFFMSSFCWMNISCVDIFWTFSGKRGFGLSNKSAERKRFLIYCLYTYLFPLCLIGIIFILNQGEKKTWFHPQFGHGQCFLGKGYPHLLYFYGPMGIMLIFNVILFTLTALKIRQINRDTAMLKRPENKMHYDRDRQTFQLYMKLLLALGINWTMEFISWLVNWTLNDTYKEIWYVTDFCNAIYGVIIFIIFVCKKSIWIMLKKRYYIFKGQPQKARSLSMRTSAFEMSQTEKTVVY